MNPLSGFTHIPHLLIQGPSTCRKYEQIHEFLHKHVEKDSHVLYIRCAHMDPELHQSYIQNQVYLFAQIKSACTRFIVFDHAEFLTMEAQSILRRYIEQFSKNVRFVFVVSPGGTHRLIIPILSRLYKVYIFGDMNSVNPEVEPPFIPAEQPSTVDEPFPASNESPASEVEPTVSECSSIYECIQQAYQSAIPPMYPVSVDRCLKTGNERFKSDKLYMLSLFT
jgi:DNA polymerase III delta prime subunit